MSDSGSDESKPANAKPNKVFVSGMDGAADLKELEAELRELFSKYGKIDAVVPKRSFNNTYCYAFIDFQDGEDATVAVEKENHRYLGEKKISVELQDDSRRRKGADLGCYECGKPGHFARECRNKKSKPRGAGRSRSDSGSRDRKKKRRRHRSSSSESRSRSRSLRKKQKRKHSRSRDKRHHGKHKKSKKDRRRSRSYSD